MKTWGDGGIAPFLTSALDGGEWWASRPSCFNPEEIARDAFEQEAGWAPEPVWMLWRREKISCPSWEYNPGRVARSQSPDRLSYADLKTASVPILLATNGRMIDDLERVSLGLIEVYRGVFLGGNTLYPFLDSNRALYEYEVGALPLGPVVWLSPWSVNCTPYLIKLQEYQCVPIFICRAGWRSGHALHSYSESARFESRPGHSRSDWCFPWGPSVRPGKFPGGTSIRSRTCHFRSFPVHSLNILPLDAM
jgi:hypothetical protein